jgi:hypothetical protein
MQKGTSKTVVFSLAILTLFCLVLSIQGKAQASVDISKKIETSKKQEGVALIHTEKGKFKLYASYGKNKLTSLYAIDGTGEKIGATYKENPAAKGVTCVVCVIVLGKSTCYLISCDQVPSPKDKAIK